MSARFAGCVVLAALDLTEATLKVDFISIQLFVIIAVPIAVEQLFDRLQGLGFDITNRLSPGVFELMQRVSVHKENCAAADDPNPIGFHDVYAQP
jgi:hypothetical protein